MSTHLPPSRPIPPPGRPGRGGCATVLLALVGFVLLLPGLCVLVMVTASYSSGGQFLDDLLAMLPFLSFLVLLAVGGILLIRAAFRS